jgi:N-acylethanolamine-hydrolysing acid amidase
MVDNSIPSAWLVRKVLEEEATYESAVQKLKSVEIGGPIYYIVSGIGKGIVIEREIKGVHAAYELNEETWFLVQTNYDRDGPEPIWDVRRSPV